MSSVNTTGSPADQLADESHSLKEKKQEPVVKRSETDIKNYRPTWLTNAVSKVRRQKGLSTSQLAKRVGCSETSLVQFEKGNQFSLALLRKISLALDVSFWELCQQAES